MKELIKNKLKEYLIEKEINIENQIFDKLKIEAAKYNTRTEFAKNSPSDYKKALKLGILDDIAKHMTPKPERWDEKKIIELAKTVDSENEFRKKYSGAYQWASKKGMFPLEGLSRKEMNWTKEKVYKIALKYNQMRDFQINDKNAYNAAYKYGWLEDITKHFKTPGNIYNRGVYVYEFADKTAYVGLTHDFDERHLRHLKDIKSKVFQHILKTNLTPIFKKITVGYIPFSEAQALEQKLIEKLRNSGWNILNLATAGGLGSISPNKWNTNSLKQEAEKYESITDFYVGSRSAYDTAKNMGILKDITKHMLRKRRKNLTDDELKNEFLKYSNLQDLKKHNPWVYRQIKKNPILFKELLSFIK